MPPETNEISSPENAGDQLAILYPALTIPAIEINLVNAVLLPILGVLTLIGNAAVMMAFYAVPALSRHKPGNLFILNLSVSDFFVGCIILTVLTPYSVLGRNPYGEVGCAIAVCLTTYISFVSLSTLCLISLDRVLLVSKDYRKYVKMMSRFRVKTTIALCWIIAAIIIIVPEVSLWEVAKNISVKAQYIDFDTSCISPSRMIKAFTGFFGLIFCFAPICVIMVLSLVFVYSLRKRLKGNRRVGAAAGQGTDVSFLPQDTSVDRTPGIGRRVSRMISRRLNCVAVTPDAKTAIANKVAWPMPNIETLNMLNRSLVVVECVGDTFTSTSLNIDNNGVISVGDPSLGPDDLSTISSLVLMNSNNIDLLSMSADSCSSDDVSGTISGVMNSHDSTTDADTTTGAAENAELPPTPTRPAASTNGVLIYPTGAADNAGLPPTPTNPAASTNGVTLLSHVSSVRDDVITKNRYLKPAVTFAVLVISLAVCSMPYIVYIMITALSSCSTCVPDFNSSVRKSLLILCYVNSTLNPFLYAMTQKKIVNYYKKVLRDVLNYLRR